MDTLFQECQEFLEHLFPLVLEQWLALGDRENTTLSNAVEAARLFYELDMPNLLPTACYAALCHCSVDELVDSDLPRALLKLLLNGRATLLSQLASTTLSWMDVNQHSSTVSPACSSPKHCQDACRHMYYSFLSIDSECEVSWVLKEFDDFYNQVSLGYRLCDNCRPL